MPERAIVSPSRTYVAMCNKTNWDGHYFRKFTLPEFIDRDFFNNQTATFCREQVPVRNDSRMAEWYFLNQLNSTACIDKCITAEDFDNLREEGACENTKKVL